MLFRGICLLALVATAYCVVFCGPNACDGVQCKEVSCGPNERLRKEGTECGCCPACIKQLQKDEDCSQLLVPGSAYQDVECAKGMSCVTIDDGININGKCEPDPQRDY